MPSITQEAFIARVEPVLSRERLARYAVTAGEPAWEALARYAWNVALCEAFYPLLHALEVVLRNRLYELGKDAFPYRRVHDVHCWLDADPSPLHRYGAADVAKAKQKLFGADRRAGALAVSRRYFAGDLVAALDFGFWTGLFNRHYLFQSSRDKRLWPHGLVQVFPHAPGRLDFRAISGRVNELRQLRNRVFHHEPIWRRPALADDRDHVLQLLDWMSPEVGAMLRGMERLSEVLSDEYRRRVRVRVYHESRR